MTLNRAMRLPRVSSDPRGCGIVVAVPEGRSTRYEFADPHLTRALDVLVDVVLAVDDGAECADEDCDVPLCCGASA